MCKRIMKGSALFAGQPRSRILKDGDVGPPLGASLSLAMTAWKSMGLEEDKRLVRILLQLMNKCLPHTKKSITFFSKYINS